MPASPAEESFALMVASLDLAGGMVREHRFHATRQWRFDFAWPARMVAVEIEGITGGAGGRHQRAAGFVADAEKYEAALALGWTVYRVPSAWIYRAGRKRKGGGKSPGRHVWRKRTAEVLRQLLCP